MIYVILSLAAFRIAKLLIDDAIFDRPRELIHRQVDPNGKLHYLLNCYWCLGLWVSALLVIAFLLWPVVVGWIALALAISAVVGLLAQLT